MITKTNIKYHFQNYNNKKILNVKINKHVSFRECLREEVLSEVDLPLGQFKRFKNSLKYKAYGSSDAGELESSVPLGMPLM